MTSLMRFFSSLFSATSSPTEPKESLRILIIDDSEEDTHLIVRDLKKEFDIVWHRVDTVSSLYIALNEQWDVFLCDYKMPSLTVEDAFVVIRSSIHHKLTPFIIISGSVNEEIAIKELKRGASDFIEKDRIQRLPLAIRREVRIAKSRYNEKLRNKIMIEESYNATIAAWGKALELRNRYTQGHTQRVADLSLKLARELSALGVIDISYEQLINLYRGSLLHDIGKMAIPDAILLKEGTLTDEEMETMKTHTTFAKMMLENISFLKEAISIPYCHHERWNGSGYPQGLAGSDDEWDIDKNPKGKGIPSLARIFSVVDVYDALTTDRPYRSSWEVKKALDYISEESGKSLDSQIVDTFIDIINRD